MQIPSDWLPNGQKWEVIVYEIRHDTFTWPSVAHFDKEGSHSLRSVVVAGDSIHHLYGGDEAGNGLQHAHRVTLIEWLAELLQGVQVLEVVFCLI